MFLTAATITNLKASFSFLHILVKQKKVLKFPVMFFICAFRDITLASCWNLVSSDFSDEKEKKIYICIYL